MNYFFDQLGVASELSCCGQYFSNLQKLILIGNTIDDDGECCEKLVTAIRQGPFSSLEELDMTETKCTVRGAKALISLNTHCDDNTAITSSSSLKNLNLFGNKLGSDGFVELSKVLRGGHPTLESLDLGGNEATEAGVVALLQAFTQHRSNNSENTTNSLRLLVVGGNQGGPTVETVVQEVQKLYPQLDIARDKPKSSNSNTNPFNQMNNVPSQTQGTSWMA